MNTTGRHLAAWLVGALAGTWLLGSYPVGAISTPTLQKAGSPVPLVVARQARKAAPALIQDIRIGAKKTYTRVVLDLQRQVTFTQLRRTNPDRLVIDIEDAQLTAAAKATLLSDEFPSGLEVFPLQSGGVRISLDVNVLASYKLLPLSNPPRLVLDLFGPLSANGSAPGLRTAPGLDGASPSLQVQPRPVVSEIDTIVIDPGHGGKDPGAVGRRGTLEKDITLRVSVYLRELLEKRLGKKVLMTRERDTFVELEDRADFANNHGADLFISIHVNAHPRRSVKGLEIYYFGKASDRRAMEVAARENRENGMTLDPNLEFILADLRATKMVQDSLELAWTTSEQMVQRLNGRYKVVNHGVKTAPFYVLRFTTMPSILAEIGYISNADEEKRIRTTAFQRDLAEAIFDGIKAYVSSTQIAAR